MSGKNQELYSLFCDLNQIERDEKTMPTKLVRTLASLGPIFDLEIDLGQQEIRDGEVIDHPVLNCKIKTDKSIEELRRQFSEDYYVIDQIPQEEAPAEPQPSSAPDRKTKGQFLVGELSLINFQQQRITDWKNLQAKANAEYLHVISKKLQKFIKSEQMVPMQIVFELVEERVNSLTMKTGKKLKTWTMGGEILLENSIIEHIVPQIQGLTSFIVENSIEEEAKRKELAKPAEAQITFKAARYDDQIELTVSDDGSGISQEKIAEIVSQLKPQLESINGKIGIHSSPENGISFKILIHETLAQIPCDLLEWQGQHFAIPLMHAKQCFDLSAGEAEDKIQVVGHHFYLDRDSKKIPVVFFDEVLNHNSKFTEDTYKDIYKRKFPLKDKAFKVYEFTLGIKHFALLVECETEEQLITVSQKACPPLLVFSGKGISQQGVPAFILDVFSIGEHTIDLNFQEGRGKLVA